MTIASVSDLCEVNPKHPGGIDPDEEIAFVGMTDLDDVSARATDVERRPFSEVSKGYTPFMNGDILMAKITPCFENGKIGQATISTDVAAGSTEFHVMRPKRDRLERRYLLHFLRQPWILELGELRMTGSGGQRRVPVRFLDELQIPLPPIEEQRRIAAVLDAADALRVKRRRAIAKLDTLTQAIFIDMMETSGWDAWGTVSLESLAAPRKGSIRTGPFGSQLLHEEFVESGVAVLGIDNAVQNQFHWGERRFITEEKYEALQRFTVFPGDVLVTIMGTCGRVAIVPEDIPKAINTKHLCCITPNRDLCHPDWLWACLRFHPRVLQDLGATHGAVMPGLNMGRIKQASIPVPPIALQEEFAVRKAACESQVAFVSNSEADLDSLFGSLQQRAFRGEL